MNRVVRVLWIVWLSLVLAACAGSGGDGGCTDDSDCPAGTTCRVGICVVQSDGGGDDGGQDDGGQDDGGQDDGGQDDGGQDDGGQDDGGDQNVDSVCGALVEGTNDGLLVDGIERAYVLNLPADVDSRDDWPVIFNYHGLGDTPQNMSRLLSGLVDNPDYPFILVTPDDTAHALTFWGQTIVMDWDVFQANEQNKEVRLFDQLLDCLDERYGIDRDRIHAVGFSMGGLLTDMMATLRGEELASVAAYSGGYWANANNRNGYIDMFADYPAFDVSNRYTQLIIHGGPTDNYDMSLFVIQFDQYAASDLTMLNDAGHDVIICNHNSGHTLPQDLMGPELVEFFAAHPMGSNPSPWAASGLPASYPAYCSFTPGR